MPSWFTAQVEHFSRQNDRHFTLRRSEMAILFDGKWEVYLAIAASAGYKE
jgi:hypothetical protein